MTTASRRHQVRPPFQKSRLRSWSRISVLSPFFTGTVHSPCEGSSHHVVLCVWREQTGSPQLRAGGGCGGLPEPSSSPAVCHGLAEALGGDTPSCVWTRKCRG